MGLSCELRRGRVSCLVLVITMAGCTRQPAAPSPAPAPSQSPWTFAVVGDNRGESSGKPAQPFVGIVQALQADSPELVLNSGDLINGYAGEDEPQLRRMWQGYKNALTPLEMPIHHVPGNHDVFDALSARLWKEYWGPTHFAFDHANARFIGLDSESDPGRLGETQFKWLTEQLSGAGRRHVFIVLHRPLFPIDGHIGNCLDKYPDERDRLHKLFVKYRWAIKGVFMGHEHLYHHERRDGVAYYISAGGGAPLYAPAEMGGFYHYLLVTVKGDRVFIDVRKVGNAPEPARGVVSLEPGTLLESWESALFWHPWDQSVHRHVTREHASEGHRGLKLVFDCTRYETPLIYAQLQPYWDLSRADVIAVDIFVPKELDGALTATTAIEGRSRHEAPAIRLKSGWNTLATDLNAGWLPKAERAAATQIQWTLGAEAPHLRGWVVFDRFRLEAPQEAKLHPGEVVAGARDRGPEKAIGTLPTLDHRGLLEGWEGGLTWGAWNDISHEPDDTHAQHGKRGLKVRFDMSEVGQPKLYARLYPMWDLRSIKSLSVEVYVPRNVTLPAYLVLSLVRDETRYTGAKVQLAHGWNNARFDVTGAWLPAEARKAAEQVELDLTAPKHRAKGWVVVDNFRTLGNTE